jgi:hypothetical protein
MYVERTVMLNRAASDRVCPAQAEIGAWVTQHNRHPHGGRGAGPVADRCVLQSALQGGRHRATSAQNSRHVGDHAPQRQLPPTTSHGRSCRRISDAERGEPRSRGPIMLSGSPFEIALSRENPSRRAHTQHNRALNIQASLDPGVAAHLLFANCAIGGVGVSGLIGGACRSAKPIVSRAAARAHSARFPRRQGGHAPRAGGRAKAIVRVTAAGRLRLGDRDRSAAPQIAPRAARSSCRLM